MLKGGGIALALPFLNAMGWAAPDKKLPKRMLVSYFSYGAYMPNGQAGIPNPNAPHHDWSWWPCRDAGPLTFNQSAKPFAFFLCASDTVKNCHVLTTPNKTKKVIYFREAPCKFTLGKLFSNFYFVKTLD